MDIKYSMGRSEFRTFEEGLEKEWLLTNGIGGYANQTIIGANSRIFSGYLVASLHPPVDRMLAFAKTHESITIDHREYDLAAQSYIGFKREGQKYLNRFELDVLPSFTYEVNGIKLKKTIAMEYGKNKTVLCYEIIGNSKEAQLTITPCFNWRPFDDVIEKSKLEFKRKLVKEDFGGHLFLKPISSPSITIYLYASDGYYYDRSLKPTSMATPNYLVEENEVYPIDNRNGFLGVDHHYTPYDIIINIKPFENKRLYLTCGVYEDKSNSKLDLDRIQEDGFTIAKEYKSRIYQLMEQIPYEDSLAKRLAWAADTFIVHRQSTGLKTIMAGYPWFADWGRDTMIALQGLALCTGRFEDAKGILESFSRYVKYGMIPNVFPERNPSCETSDEITNGVSGKNSHVGSLGITEPMYNTIDASLWYFYSVYKYLQYTGKPEDYQFIKDKIYSYLKEIIEAYKQGTLYGIRMDEDGLIEGGSNLDQLTWMDVRVGDWVVTPRHGKAVEINALWYNALRILHQLADYYGEDGTTYLTLSEKVKDSFSKKFWNEEKECLYDVISKEKDSRIRPNQIYAVSLPFSLLDRDKEKKIVQVVKEHLYTPYGLRSLSKEDNEYKGTYIGKLIMRDGAYHMGTAWGYLMGAFITAFCKVEDYRKEAILQAKEMCEYFADHMEDGCINGIAEIFDGDFACTSRGCYTQAWSVGEILRAYTEDVLKYVSEYDSPDKNQGSVERYSN